MNEDQTLTQETPVKRAAGRPRRVSLDDDDGLLDEALKIQRGIMNDRTANAATRERAAGEVRELVKQRQQRRDDEAKATLSAEVTRLQGEVERLTQQIADTQQSALGKVDVSEVTSLRTELTRLRSDAATAATRLTSLSAERDRAMNTLRFVIDLLPDKARAAMQLLISEGTKCREMLALFGVPTGWLQLATSHQTKKILLETITASKTDRPTELLTYCRLRLSVEHNIDDVETYLQQEEQRKLQGEAQRLADTAFLNVEQRLSR